MQPQTGGHVARVDKCSLTVGPGTWVFADRHRDEIERHWARRSAENPGFFNGVIHLLTHHGLADGCFRGAFVRTDFKSYLYWRETGFPEAGVHDAFGSALIRSVEGHVLLGRQREGNINSGLAYLPGGFIDVRDVDAGGTIDIRASVLREVGEETGIPASAFAQRPGYYLTFAGLLISVAVELVSSERAEDLRAQMLAHMRQDPASELVDAVIVRSRTDLDGLAMPDYARILIEHLI